MARFHRGVKAQYWRRILGDWTLVRKTLRKINSVFFVNDLLAKPGVFLVARYPQSHGLKATGKISLAIFKVQQNFRGLFGLWLCRLLLPIGGEGLANHGEVFGSVTN